MLQTENKFERKRLNVTAVIQAVTKNNDITGILNSLESIGFIQSTDDLIKRHLNGKIESGVGHFVSSIIAILAALLLVLALLLIKFYCKVPEVPERPNRPTYRADPIDPY